jgi:hypothetical protein
MYIATFSIALIMYYEFLHVNFIHLSRSVKIIIADTICSIRYVISVVTQPSLVFGLRNFP